MIAVMWSLSPLASKVFLSLFFNCLVARTQWSIHILCANMLKAVLHPSLSFKYEAPLYTWKVPIMMKNCYNVHRNFFIRSFICTVWSCFHQNRSEKHNLYLISPKQPSQSSYRSVHCRTAIASFSIIRSAFSLLTACMVKQFEKRWIHQKAYSCINWRTLNFFDIPLLTLFKPLKFHSCW